MAWDTRSAFPSSRIGSLYPFASLKIALLSQGKMAIKENFNHWLLEQQKLKEENKYKKQSQQIGGEAAYVIRDRFF
jgi:hypothetical protein